MIRNSKHTVPLVTTLLATAFCLAFAACEPVTDYPASNNQAGTGGSTTNTNPGTGGSSGTGGTPSTGTGTPCDANHVGQMLPGTNLQCQFISGSGQYGWVQLGSGTGGSSGTTSTGTGGMTGGTGQANVACTQTSSKTGMIQVSGDVLGNLFELEYGAVSSICLVGDPLQGWTGNRTLCQPYIASSSNVYTWAGLPMPSPTNRVTFLGVTAKGERWSNNSALVISGSCGYDDAMLKLYFKTSY